MARILVADDQEMMRDSLAATLVREGHEVVAAGDGAAAVARLSGPGRFDLLITDLKMPKLTGIELLAEAKRLRPEMPVVLMTAFATVATAVEAMKLGAYDYIQKPFDGDEIKHLVDRTLEHNRLIRENQALRVMSELTAPRPLVGSGELMAEVRKKIDLIAKSSATVLIRGESGTGKEVVARAVHYASPRRERPFLAVNCAALSENLLESELFGHERGAFTGADKMRRGRFELADGGSLLLDEISEIAPALQAKLLRVLQESTFERVGSSISQQVDVRVIATTNRDLEAAADEGKFRQDLFYRLNVVPIDLPPLRQRSEDIYELCRHFLHQISKRENTPFRHVESDALRLLQRYPWPGNVRELQNIIERASVLESEPGVIRASTIEPWLRTRPAAASAVEDLAGKPLADIEKRVILSTLQQFKGHRLKTAGALGIGVRTLGMKLKRWKEDGELIEAESSR
ncbi:MAG: NtrC family two-component system response regulator [Phycisphaerales bacterium]|nr:NtrC family two-component system response regulator [Phycisphaerales bacterium]MDB5305419.1 NtrC family two-component system response regulator [Phycisphaerales bacterium]